MKTLLVPTDFSQHAENALHVAAQLARNFNAKIYLVHYISLDTAALKGRDPNEVNSPERVYLKRAKKELAKTLKNDFLKNVDVIGDIEIKNIYDGVNEAVIKYDIDVILIGSQGINNIRGVRIGSTSDKIVRHATAPVLVIKGRMENFKVKDIIFATDLDPKGTPAYTKTLVFSKPFSAQTHVVYINTPKHFQSVSEIQEKKKKFFETLPGSPPDIIIYDEYYVEKGIFKVCNQFKAQVISMATTGFKGLKHILKGSLSEDMANQANEAVLTFRV